MERAKIFHKVDHTLLNQTATWEEIRRLCDEAISYHTASVCIPPSYVAKAKAYVTNQMPVCTVIGFPNGYHTTETKVFETENAIANGADEIDMVIDIGYLKDKQYEKILSEIKAVKEACQGRILKVIVETCLLTEEEKIEMCRLVSQSGAEYIKTSTGFSTKGATLEDVALFAKYVDNHVKIKAAGGISSFADAENFIAAGASRLGTSRLIKLAEAEKR